jgi:hypothetical protein
MEMQWIGWRACWEMLTKEKAEAARIVELIELLVADEGNSCQVVCPNPDWNDLPNRVIEVSAEWTDWKPRRFGGDTLLAALEAAVKCRPE